MAAADNGTSDIVASVAHDSAELASQPEGVAVEAPAEDLAMQEPPLAGQAGDPSMQEQSSQPVVAAEEVETVEDGSDNVQAPVKCRRCATEVKREDALENPKFRPELRWTCRSCHACHTQLSRHGIQLTNLLNESETVAFFAEAKAVRENSCDGRLSYGQARGVLKQQMMESCSREDREGDHGEFQPLSYWQLKGYNTDNIETLAESRDHPILGPTYRVDITKKSTEFIAKLTEERIVRMETEFLQRMRSAAAEAAGPAPLQLDLPPAAPEPVPRAGKKRKSPEEKQQDREAAKLAKQEAKKRQKLEATAVAAAGKHLPALQKLHAKLDDVTKKASFLSVALTPDIEELVTSASAEIEQTMSNATKLLNGAAKEVAVWGACRSQIC